MYLFRYAFSLGLMLLLTVPALAQAPQLHPETGEEVLASETAPHSLLRTEAGGSFSKTHGSDDLTLIKHLAAGETRGIAVVGNVLYRSNGGYFEALDVSNPDAPVLLSRVIVETSIVQDVQIVGDLAYVVSARSNFPQGAGLHLVDISDPANLTVVGQALGQTAFGVTVSGDYAYVAAATTGFSVYDVSDASVPSRVTTLPVSGASLLKVAVDGTTAYVSGGNAGFRTIDVTDPENPSVLGSLATSGFATNVAYANGVAYVLVNSAGVLAVDVSDPANPTQLGHFPIASSQVRGIMVEGNTALVTSQIGLSVLDITDPAAITETGFVPFDNTGSGQSVVREGDVAYVGNRFDGVRVIDLSSPSAPEEIALIQNGGFSFKVFVQGDYAYVSDLIGEYRIIDISNPENAEIVGRADALPNTSGSTVRDGIAYVVDRTGAAGTGLTTFDVSDPTSPVAIDTFTTGSQSFGIDLVGDVAYIANGFFQFISVDVSEPGSFSTLDNFNPNSNAFGVQVRDDVAYVANFGGGLVTVDVSDPSAMVQLNTNVVGGFLSSVALDGNRAYLADGQVGLNVVDVSDPAMPQSLGTGSIAGIASGVAYSQGFAYIADEGFGLRQYDVTDPTNPVETAAVISADRMTDVDVEGDLVVAVDAGGGVYLFRARDNTPSGIAAVAPEALSLTVEEGTTGSATLTLSNTGAGPLTYHVSTAAARTAALMIPQQDEQARASQALGQLPAAAAVASSRTVSGLAYADGSAQSGPWVEDLGDPRAFYRSDEVTITHSASMVINELAGVSCGDNTVGYTSENSYWRVFDLSEFALSGGLDVTSVDVGVEAVAGSDLSSSVRLYTLDGAFSRANLTLVGEADFTLEAGTALETVNVPVTGSFGADDVLVVEWNTESGEPTLTTYYPGANAAGQTGPTYLSAESCGLTEPTDVASIGFADMHWVLAVNGTAGSPPVVTVTPGSGTIEAGGSAELAVTIDAAALTPGTYEYVITISTNSPETPELAVPVTVEVSATVSNEEDGVPTVFALEQNYPNPFAGGTTLGYALPVATHVRIEVYDAVGRRVAILVDEDVAAGRHDASWEARDMASGVYLYRIQAGEYTKTLKMSLVR